MNWDDLRVAMAVHRAGSYAKAGSLLRIDETTVARRLGRLQRDLGFALFDAVDGARRPTAKCRELLSHIESMSRHAGSIAALDDESNGPVGH